MSYNLLFIKVELKSEYLDKFIKKYIYLFIMNLQDFSSKAISITQIRQDIDVLKQALKQQGIAWVTRNQDIMFIAIDPKEYKELVEKKSYYEINDAVDKINEIQAKYGNKESRNSTEVISEMREERAKRWKK